MFIAVATKSGTDVDQHFGHAERFHIYQYRATGSELIKTVEVEKYCSFDPDHPFRHRQFDAIVQALAGCKAVVTAQIGELPKNELAKAGIHAITTSGPINEALKFAHDSICGGNCRGGQQTSVICRHG